MKARCAAALLVLLACLVAVGCVQRNGSGQDPHNGFYGGVSGGLTRP